MNAGADAFLLKPASKDMLIKTLHKWYTVKTKRSQNSLNQDAEIDQIITEAKG